jgi:hypothetical protein
MGQGATIPRPVTEAVIAGLAAVSGGFDPTRLDEAYARAEGLNSKTAQWAGGAAHWGHRAGHGVRVEAMDHATSLVTLDGEGRRASGPRSRCWQRWNASARRRAARWMPPTAPCRCGWRPPTKAGRRPAMRWRRPFERDAQRIDGAEKPAQGSLRSAFSVTQR